MAAGTAALDNLNVRIAKVSCVHAQTGEECFDLAGESHHRVHPGAVQFASRQLELRHRGARLFDPAHLAIKRANAVSPLRVILEDDLRGALIGSFGENLEAATAAQRFVTFTGAGGDEAGEAGDLLGSAERRNIFVDNLGASRLTGSGRDDVIFFVVGSAVESIERDRGPGNFAAVMASPAGHHLRAAEVSFIDGADHINHLARSFLLRGIEYPIDFVAAGTRVAIRAIKTQVCRYDPHGRHEVVHGEPFERTSCNVLEGGSSGIRFRRGLRHRVASPDEACQPDAGHGGNS